MKAIFGPSGNSERFYAEGHKKTIEAFQWLRELDLDAFEYPAGNGITASPSTFEAFGKEAQKYGIKTSFHAPYFISLSSTELEKRLKSVEYIQKSETAARALCADTVVIHTGSASKISREEAVRLAADTMYKTLEAIPSSPVFLGLETMGKKNQLGTLDEVIAICKLDSRLRPVVDFGHINAREGGCFFTRDDYRRIFHTIAETLGDEVAQNLHCHFSKIEYTTAGEKRHLTFDDTVYGPAFEPLIEVIAEDKLTPRIICESSGTMADDALTMKRYYESLTQQEVL